MKYFIKKITCFVLFSFIVLSIMLSVGCKQKTKTIKLDENTKIEVSYKTEDNMLLEIIVKNKDKVLQTIKPQNDEIFTDKPVYFEDITFSEQKSILIPLKNSDNAVIFEAYIWDKTANKFIQNESFQSIKNPVIDSKNKVILSKCINFEINSYCIYKFNENSFKIDSAVNWQPSSMDSGKSGENDIHFVEVENGKIKNEWYIETYKSDAFELNENNEKVKPYFEKNSFWDLNSQKWDKTFFKLK